MRDRSRDHTYGSATARAFCEKYDQNGFDPEDEALPLEAFEPAARTLFARPAKTSFDALAEGSVPARAG